MTSSTVITSTKNPLIQCVIKLHQAKGRKKEGAILLEGTHAIKQALGTKTRWSLTHVFLPHPHQNIAEAFHFLDKTLIHVVEPHVMKAISTTDSAPPIAAIAVETQDYTPWHWQKIISLTPRLFILDNIQDPGNMGTLIRSAVAFGLDGILLTGDCADHLSPKVIRASVGHSLSAPILHTHQHLVSLLNDWEQSNAPFTSRIRLWGTCGERAPDNTVAHHMSGKFFGDDDGHAVILGNEGQGLDTETLKTIEQIQWLTIPTQNVESLNVAVSGSIIAYMLSQSETDKE